MIKREHDNFNMNDVYMGGVVYSVLFSKYVCKIAI